jgi:hypothetical protein
LNVVESGGIETFLIRSFRSIASAGASSCRVVASHSGVVQPRPSPWKPVRRCPRGFGRRRKPSLPDPDNVRVVESANTYTQIDWNATANHLFTVALTTADVVKFPAPSLNHTS